MTLGPPQGDLAGVGEGTSGVTREEPVAVNVSPIAPLQATPVLSSPNFVESTQVSTWSSCMSFTPKDATGRHEASRGGTLAAPLGPLNGCPPGPRTSFSVCSPVNQPRACSSRSTQVFSPVQCHGPSGAGDFSAPGPSNSSLGLGPLWPGRVRGGVINHSFLLQKC